MPIEVMIDAMESICIPLDSIWNENEPHRFVSTRDVPELLPPALAMGTMSDSGLVISDARRREMLAQKGSRWLTTEPVSVIPESLVDREPKYLSWPRARRKE